MKCHEKTKMTQAVADQVVVTARNNKRRPAVLYSYQCCKCGFWHMTHKPPRPVLHWTLQYGTKHHQQRTA